MHFLIELRLLSWSRRIHLRSVFPFLIYSFENFLLSTNGPGRKVHDRPGDSTDSTRLVKQRGSKESHSRLSKRTKMWFLPLVFFHHDGNAHTIKVLLQYEYKNANALSSRHSRTQDRRRNGFLMVFRNASFMPYFHSRDVQQSVNK